MTDSITSIEFADERRDIDAEFAHLREIMESRSFRTNSGLAGEQPYYIYDYPAVQELDVAEHTKQLANQLRTMMPKYDGDFAPQVLTLDLYDIALEILDDRHILDRVLRNEKRRHVKMSSNVHADKFLGLLDNVMGADTDQLPNTIRKHYEEAKAEGGADIVFITGNRIHHRNRQGLSVYPCAYVAQHVAGAYRRSSACVVLPGHVHKKHVLWFEHVIVRLSAGRQLLPCAKLA